MRALGWIVLLIVLGLFLSKESFLKPIAHAPEVVRTPASIEHIQESAVKIEPVEKPKPTGALYNSVTGKIDNTQPTKENEINEMGETQKLNAGAQAAGFSDAHEQQKQQLAEIAAVLGTTPAVAPTPASAPVPHQSQVQSDILGQPVSPITKQGIGICKKVSTTTEIQNLKRRMHLFKNPPYRIPRAFFERLGEQVGHLVKCPVQDHGYHLFDEHTVGVLVENKMHKEVDLAPLAGLSIEARDYVLSLSLRENLQIHMYKFGYVVYEEESGVVLNVELKD